MSDHDTSPPVQAQPRWRGLGWWNAYFIAKLLLYATGRMQFDVYLNLLLLAALLFPLQRLWRHRLRQVLAIPAGVALAYHDTWYPPFSRLIAQGGELLQFSNAYLLELLGRFINWDLIGAGFIFLVAYLFLSQWLRMTVFTLAAFAWVSAGSLTGFSLALSPLPAPAVLAAGPVAASVDRGTTGALPVAQAQVAAPGGKPDNQQLNQTLVDFYAAQKEQTVAYPAAPGGTQPFDVLVLSICSLSWADLQASNLMDHPLFQRMDVVFDQFNSATSYSGQAVMRLMRASCGQTSHQALYQPGPDHCYLFDNLQALGFKTETALNHNGQFEGFLDEITRSGRFATPYIPNDRKPALRAFDGSPIWGDLDTLNQWWKNRQADDAGRVALLYNTITLHDGNREPTADGASRASPFESRASVLLDSLAAFLDELQRSGRKIMVVIVPEHGAALQGDRMQIPGMREIPSPSITRVPVAVRLIGAQAPHQAPVRVHGTTSYLALSQLMSRLLAGQVFEQPSIDWQTLTADLPQTPWVSENDGTVLMDWHDVPYVRMGQSPWIPYPQ